MFCNSYTDHVPVTYLFVVIFKNLLCHFVILVNMCLFLKIFFLLVVILCHIFYSYVPFWMSSVYVSLLNNFAYP